MARPPKFKAADDMQKAIDRYFAECELKEKPRTYAGLAISLGFTSRQSLLNYEEKPEFLDTIKRARLVVQEDVESRLFGANATGSIFWLKNNADYRDRSEQEITGKDGGPVEIRGIDVAFITPGKD